MTTHYVDLTVLPDPESGVPLLLGALYDRLHRILAIEGIGNIGVSFPHYSTIPRVIGDTLRLHGTAPSLERFTTDEWLRGMRDHVRKTAIEAVPGEAIHRLVKRRQFKSNVERLRRRRMKRKGETAEQAARHLPASAAEKPNLPYLHMRSLSTGQPFCLFVAMGPMLQAPIPGRFNSYGLSQGATIPWF